MKYLLDLALKNDLFTWDDLVPETDVLGVLFTLSALLDQLDQFVELVEEEEPQHQEHLPQPSEVDNPILERPTPTNFPDLVPLDDQPKLNTSTINPITPVAGNGLPSSLWRARLETLALSMLLIFTLLFLYYNPADETPFNGML